MRQVRDRLHPDHRLKPPGIATDGKRAYEEAMVATWGQVPPYKGHGKRPTNKKPAPGWQYVRLIKKREGHRLVCVDIQVVFGDPQAVLAFLGGHTSRIERTFLTSRQMNGRLVRKTLSFSKREEPLENACAWEDAVYNLCRPCKTLRQEMPQGQTRWSQRSPAMAAGITKHIWTIKEMLWNVAVPNINSQ